MAPRAAVLAVVVSALAVGCDASDAPDALAAPPEATLDSVDDALNDGFCADGGVRTEALTGTERGTLDDGDCFRALINGPSATDAYAFRLDEDAAVRLEAESDAFDPLVSLFEADPDSDDPLTFVDGAEGEGGAAQVREELADGLYVVLVESPFGSDGGPYSVTVEAEPADD